MHTLWCLLVSANVPRMRLCSSLFVVENSICDPEVNAECATNEVAVLCLLWNMCSLGWFAFFQRGVGFSQAMSLSTPCEKFQFLIITLKV